MSDDWAARLLLAMEDDEIGEVNGNADEPEPPPGPWERRPDAVADHVIAAALLGYPTEEDADTIATTPGALERLARRWADDPPSDAVIRRAATNPALRRLLTNCRAGRVNDGAREGEGEEQAEPALTKATPARQFGRLRSLRTEGFALAAADRAGARHEELWSGGRIIRQRLPDGTTAVTAECGGDGSASGERDEDPHVVALSAPFEPATPLLLLILIQVAGDSDGAGGTSSDVGQAVVSDDVVRGELEVAGPVPLSSLTDAELAAVPDSVAWSRGAWASRWRRAAQAAGAGSRLYEAVLRGTRHD